MPISNTQEFFIQWHLTERCNLNCRHCYQTGGQVDELSRREIVDVLDEIAGMIAAWEDAGRLEFSTSLNVTGGEPFLRADLFELLAEMRARDFAVYLLTNGTLIDATKARALVDLGVSGVQVSLEGPLRIHDSIRGKGSFDSSCRGVKHLLGAGLEVTLNATLSDLNADKFGDMINIATGLGVHRLGFSRLVPSGRGRGLVARMLASERVREIYAEIFSLPEGGGLKIVTGDPVASQLRGGSGREDCGDVATGGCAAGVSGLTLLPDGSISPCRRLGVTIGNVRGDSLREVWATSPVLEQLRDRRRYRGKCGRCRRWAVCRGCRAIAYAHSQARGGGDLLAEDPQCFMDE